MRKFFIFLLSVFFLSAVHGLELYKGSATCSYYAEKFHGRKTANGERFNMYDLTCAHKSLPFNTVLRVTNLANGKTVDVRINDRGPFVADREVDLSKAAASKIGMIKTGTAKCRIEIVKRGPETKQSTVSAKKAQNIPIAKSKGSSTTSKPATIVVTKGKLYDIQLASFGKKENAKAYAKKVVACKIKNVALQKADDKTRVLVIKVDGKDVPAVMNKLEANGFGGGLVRERK
ncbi:MAG: septal ring lytic transglycosylase RlpA family protein [Treponema sp.]|nr:septal ring lytic transglycosylase RlpA family protein [Candidatus Treponema equi]